MLHIIDQKRVVNILRSSVNTLPAVSGDEEDPMNGLFVFGTPCRLIMRLGLSALPWVASGVSEHFGVGELTVCEWPDADPFVDAKTLQACI